MIFLGTAARDFTLALTDDAKTLQFNKKFRYVFLGPACNGK